MDGYLVVHSHDPALALDLDPRGGRLNQKVAWSGVDGAVRFARQEDAMKFGETFAPGSFRVMPAKPEAAKLRVLDETKGCDRQAEAAARYASGTKPKAPPTRVVTEGAKSSR